MRHGKFIVFYGINSLGKSTQAEILTSRLKQAGLKTASPIKYAVYGLEPTGTLINEYLRGKNGLRNPRALSAQEFQMLQAMNRYQFEPTLLEKLNKGFNVVAEDYAGTGIAWGIANNVDFNFLETVNSGLLKEDIVFLFTGNQFSSGREKNHTHESNSSLTKRAYESHLRLAEKYGWIKIDANRDAQNISDEIFEHVKTKLFYRKPLKFYFGMSIINSDRSNLEEGKEIVGILKKHGEVLSEHVVRDDVMEFEAENIKTGVNIFKRDISWVENSDYLIIEGSKASTGIGRELQRANDLGIPILFLYRQELKGKITRMVTDDDSIIAKTYEKKEDLEGIIEEFLSKNRIFIG
ncbi:MAG: hypothetical protein AABW41_02280 [Nanoarchaeota archaeon]